MEGGPVLQEQAAAAARPDAPVRRDVVYHLIAFGATKVPTRMLDYRKYDPIVW